MKNTKTFRFKFNLAIWLLLSLVLVISLISVGLNVYNLINQASIGYDNLALTVIMLIFSALLSAFTVSVMTFSKYSVKTGYLYNYFGFLRYKTKLSQIAQFTLFKESEKLVVYFADEKFSVVVISPACYDDFIRAIREVNPKIIYTVQEKEN